MSKPWDGLIPLEDLAGFGGAARQERPLSAGTRPALLVVDMQRAFVESAYPTGFSQTGAGAVAAIANLLAVARRATLPIYFTVADTGERAATAAERGRWKTLGPHPWVPPPGIPSGETIAEPLLPEAGEMVIDKGSRPSAFFGTPLASLMIHAGCDTAIICGMTTSGCVRATVLDAFQYNFHCVVPFECTADRSQLSHRVSLFDLHMKYADVVGVDAVIAYVESLTARPGR